MGNWGSLYKDILHIYFSPYYRMLSEREFEKVAPSGSLRRVKVMAKTLLKRSRQLHHPDFTKADVNSLKGKLWLFALSKNNLDTLSFIHDAFQDSIFLLDKPRKEFAVYRRVIPNLRFQVLYIFLFPYLLLLFRRREGSYAGRLAPVILRAVGFFEEWRRILKKARPKAIIFANDHNIESRSLLLAASSLRIPTVYLQHASVSSSFPPLKFDLALLEGMDALEKYEQIGPVNGRVRLVGMAKFDRYLKSRKLKTEIGRIGIPYNLNDDLKVIKDLIMKLNFAFPEKYLTVRKHPKDRRNFSLLSTFPFLIESDPANESAFEFLIKQDCIISGNSSIHLEASLLNIVSIYFNMDKGSFIDDYYGYVKNGLISSARDIDEIISLMKAAECDVQSSLYLKARRYNAAIETEWEGRSQDLVIDSIVEFIDSNAVVQQA